MAEIILYGLKNCDTCKKASNALESAGKNVTFIDIRDPRELWRDGTIPGAINVTRGMIEMWIDPQSPYAKDYFQTGNKFIFFCAGAWRSALATRTAQDMGLAPVCHIDGGFDAWKKAGAPVEAVEPKHAGGAPKQRG